MTNENVDTLILQSNVWESQLSTEISNCWVIQIYLCTGLELQLHNAARGELCMFSSSQNCHMSCQKEVTMLLVWHISHCKHCHTVVLLLALQMLYGLQVLKDDAMTIFQLGLCPAAKLYLGTQGSPPFLRPEIVSLLDGVPDGGNADNLGKSLAKHKESGQSEKLNSEVSAAHQTYLSNAGAKPAPKWLKLSKKWYVHKSTLHISEWRASIVSVQLIPVINRIYFLFFVQLWI